MKYACRNCIYLDIEKKWCTARKLKVTDFEKYRVVCEKIFVPRDKEEKGKVEKEVKDLVSVSDNVVVELEVRKKSWFEKLFGRLRKRTEEEEKRC